MDLTIPTTAEPLADLTLPQPRSLMRIGPYHSRGASYGFDLTAAGEPLGDLTLPQLGSLLRILLYRSLTASCGFDLTAARRLFGRRGSAGFNLSAAAEPLADLTLPQPRSLLRIQLLHTAARLRLLLAHSDQRILQYIRILHFMFVFKFKF